MIGSPLAGLLGAFTGLKIFTDLKQSRQYGRLFHEKLKNLTAYQLGVLTAEVETIIRGLFDVVSGARLNMAGLCLT
ncbi:hypothetical protein GCM10007380_40560 [Gottfriedia solisilvae]|uniref:Uncharacterized protein n=1 Tax=Gottfriedia solisilvae TaxID=1516104 RepID=A0A8J3APW7_9BACI|nr:hypothetical protein GCM10007380_40560 [Gottfriedia solisilvae]